MIWLAACTRPPPARYADQLVVRMEVHSAADLDALDALGADLWSEHVDDSVLVRVHRADLHRLPEPWTVAIPDLEVALAAAAPQSPSPLDFFDDWRPLSEIDDHLDDLAAQVPWATVLDIGTSYEGRTIHALSLHPPHAEPDDRLGFVISATQHAREWVAASSALYVADALVDGYGTDPALTDLLDHYRIWIVPVANPDGYEYTWTTDRLWRKNRVDNGDGSFGVDLNRNWDAAWGGTGSAGVGSSENYRGPAPFSEPESSALADFLVAHQRAGFYVDLHCTGQLALRPWGFTPAPAPDDGPLATGSAAAAAAMSAVSGSVYDEGPFNTRLYPGSGVAIDWAYGVRGAWSWLFELRDRGQYGFLLPADQIVPTGEEALAGILAVTTVPERPRLFLNHEQPFVAGDPVEMWVWRAPAGSTVQLFRSATGLGTTTLADGTTLDLADAQLLRTRTADDHGAAALHFTVPSGAGGSAQWFQARAGAQPSVVIAATMGP